MTRTKNQLKHHRLSHDWFNRQRTVINSSYDSLKAFMSKRRTHNKQMFSPKLNHDPRNPPIGKQTHPPVPVQAKPHTSCSINQFTEAIMVVESKPKSTQVSFYLNVRINPLSDTFVRHLTVEVIWSPLLCLPSPHHQCFRILAMGFLHISFLLQ